MTNRLIYRINVALSMVSMLQLGACSATKNPNSGIFQIVETRNGSRGMWGCEIQLHDSRFPAVLNANDLKIVEEKHGSDITDMMTWSISPDRSRLTIRFKPGSGDFGSGNEISISIARRALTNYMQPNEPHWTISTDPF